MTDLVAALADAFAVEERKDGRVNEIHVARDVYDAIASHGFDGHNYNLWGATVVLRKKLRKSHVTLRYERSVILPGPAPSAENFWHRDEKIKRFRKTVNLTALRKPPDPQSTQPTPDA